MIRLLSLVLVAPALAAQTPPDVAFERSAYVAWLKEAPNSPLLAVAQQTIGDSVRLGPADSDIPLPGAGDYRIYRRGNGLFLEGEGGTRPLARGGPHRLGDYTMYLSGPPPGTVLTVYKAGPIKEPPGYFDYDASMKFTGPLVRSQSRNQIRVLASDGIEAMATEVGTFVVPVAGGISLRVLRIPIAGGDESELEIFFRDGTNGNSTYPAGRFVSLHPLPNGRFVLDFNRARNPFCAYNSVYPCPAPWRGNTIPAPIRAGERYTGGGLETIPAEQQPR
jgi:hypothetical protein